MELTSSLYIFLVLDGTRTFRCRCDEFVPLCSIWKAFPTTNKIIRVPNHPTYKCTEVVYMKGMYYEDVNTQAANM